MGSLVVSPNVWATAKCRLSPNCMALELMTERLNFNSLKPPVMLSDAK